MSARYIPEEPVTQPNTAEEQQAAIDKEYGVYVATEPINVGSVRAFNVGDPVPVSHVERGVVDSASVAKRDTKAGRAAAGITDDTPKG